MLLFLGYLTVDAQHWECVVHESDTWKYYPATSAVSTNWYKASFDDSAWPSASGGFGYSDGDDNKVISSVNSVYLRTKFSVSNLSDFQELILDIDYDDAFVCYLNDVEVARSSNITASLPVYNSTLTTDHEAKLYQGGIPERYFLKISQLKQGENILSVQVLNNGIGSSDLSSRVYLNAKIEGSQILYGSTPFWFAAPVSFNESNLPILIIQTNGQEIKDEPKITAELKVLNQPGTNSINDTVFEYNGKIGIEIRGSSSQTFEKKNYAFETRNDLGENLNVSLLGLAKENDWVLHGPYADKSLIRNALTFEIGNRMNRWAPRTAFCELYINNDYRGVYVLMEKIKIDKNRLDIATLKDSDIVGDELTGGYIMKVDREDPGYFSSVHPDRSGDYSIKFSYVDPEYDELKTQQRDYIRKYIRDFEAALYYFNYNTNPDQYIQYVDLESFVDYFIVQELAKNVDAYRLSTYLYKDKDSKGGKLTMGPLWDFNFTYGMPDYLDGWQTTDWVLTEQYWSIPFWWDRLRVDPRFNSKLKRRWTSLRQNGVLHVDSLMAIVDRNAQDLQEAQARNYSRFPILSTYVWPNYYLAGTYSNEINYTKNWIKGRLLWMDGQINAIVDIFQGVEDLAVNNLNLQVYPNPARERVNFRFELEKAQRIQIKFYDLTGNLVKEFDQIGSEGANLIQLDFDSSSPSLQIYQVQLDDIIVSRSKIIFLKH